jgi:predicted Zn-dependent protease
VAKIIKRFPLIILLLCLITEEAFAFTIIRDAEIEHSIQTISAPIFKAAGISTERTKIYIINDNHINAFTDGKNIFIHTGLLTEFSDPEPIMGVIAHEVGHITGKHIIRSKEKEGSIAIGAIGATVIGIAAAALGAPDAGMGITLGGYHAAEREALSYSRENEQKADQAAINYLVKSNNSPEALLKTMEHFKREESTKVGINQYTRTHPLGRERVEHVKNSLKEYKSSDFAPLPSNIKAEYKRSALKLKAFLTTRDRMIKKIASPDKGIDGKYAQAIYLYRLARTQEAVKVIDELITTQPKDPYFHELKGQVLFESGHIKEGLQSYKEAAKLLNNNALLKLEVATVQIALAENETNTALLSEAIQNIHYVIKKEPENSFAFKQLAIAYGKLGKLGESYLAMAEEALLQEDMARAKKYAKLAESKLSKNSPAFLRAKDLLASSEKTE